MPILNPNVGEQLAGVQAKPGNTSRPAFSFESDPDTGFYHRGVQGEVGYVSNGVETARFTADGLLLPLLDVDSVVITSATGTLTTDVGLTYNATSNRLTVTGDIVVPAIGPTATQLHTLQAVAASTIALYSNNLSVFAATTSAQLAGVLSDETGTGLFVLQTSPTLITPLLGTPTSGVLTNCTGLPAASVVAGTFGSGNFTFPADLTITDQLIVSGIGPHAIGGATTSVVQLDILGNLATGERALRIASTINPGAGIDAYLFEIDGTIVEAGSGTHADFVGALLRPPAITAGGAALTNASTLKIFGAPTGATNNYALWVDAGAVRLDATTANGTVATAMSSLGPAGANTTIQEWLTININGTVRYIPCF